MLDRIDIRGVGRLVDEWYTHSMAPILNRDGVVVRKIRLGLLASRCVVFENFEVGGRGVIM
jgi:hypothetical protein